MNNGNKFFSDEFLTKALKVLGVVLLFLAVLFMLSLFSDFLSTIWSAITSALVPFIIAWLISLVMYPAIQFFERRGVGPRGLSVTIVYLIVGVLGYYEALVSYFQNDFRSEFIFGTEIYDQILTFINESTIIEDTVSGFVNTLTTSLGSSITGIIAVIMVLPILLLYYLVDYELINDNIRSILPVRYEKDASDLGNRMNRTVGAYIRGQIILMFAIGTAATIAYRLVGLNYFFIFGLIVGLTNIIPYFGAIIAMVPVLIYAIITKDVNPFLILAINILLQFTEGNIFQPMIMGRQLEMHPLVIIGSILFFGSLFGALGVVFAAPLAATIRVLFNFYKEKREQRLTT